MNVAADLYEEVMNPESMFKLTAAVRVVESNKLLATTEVFNLKKPALEFEVWLFLYGLNKKLFDVSYLPYPHLFSP